MMTLIKLSKEKLVNVKSIDKQHNEIADSINRLYELVKKGTLQAQIKEMEKFNKLINEHFDNEDRLMVEYKDPGYISHKLEHNRMRAKTQSVLDNLKLKGEMLTEDYVTGLKTWLDNHLDFKDLKLGKYLNSLGIH